MKFDLKLIGYITTFENISHAQIKDCFFDRNNILVFVVGEGDFGRAVGKSGVNVKRLGNALKKRIKVIEYNHDAVKFVKNCLLPLKVDVVAEGLKIVIKCADTQERAIVFGRDKQNLHALKELFAKFFDEEIVVQ